MYLILGKQFVISTWQDWTVRFEGIEMPGAIGKKMVTMVRDLIPQDLANTAWAFATHEPQTDVESIVPIL